jgi:predicted nucleic acid-binding protein
MAALAMADLVAMGIEYMPCAACSERIWELRHNVAPSDAWHVTIAELLDARLATLDPRLMRATGPRCRFVTPG